MNAVAQFHFSRRGVFHAIPIEGSQEPGRIFAAARNLRGGHAQSRRMTR